MTEGLYADVKLCAYCQPTTPLSRQRRDISPYTGAIVVQTFSMDILRVNLAFGSPCRTRDRVVPVTHEHSESGMTPEASEGI